jgi:hypothetical protein
MVSIILCELQTFHKTPELHNIIRIMPNATNRDESDASLAIVEDHSKARTPGLPLDAPSKFNLVNPGGRGDQWEGIPLAWDH